MYAYIYTYTHTHTYIHTHTHTYIHTGRGSTIGCNTDYNDGEFKQKLVDTETTPLLTAALKGTPNCSFISHTRMPGIL